jgi:hypothetical protein
MGLTEHMNQFKYLVDDNFLDVVYLIPKCERLFAREQQQHTFKRRMDAERYRLNELCNHHKLHRNNSDIKFYTNKLKNIDEEHPEWLI